MLLWRAYDLYFEKLMRNRSLSIEKSDKNNNTIEYPQKFLACDTYADHYIYAITEYIWSPNYLSYISLT